MSIIVCKYLLWLPDETFEDSLRVLSSWEKFIEILPMEKAGQGRQYLLTTNSPTSEGELINLLRPGNTNNRIFKYAKRRRITCPTNH